MISRLPVQRAAYMVRQGGIIAYPTEAVFGLGCDPRNESAVRRLLAIKRRPVSKGVILIAADLEQLKPFIDPLDPQSLAQVQATWPGPVTWLVPARHKAPIWLRGSHPTLAVRVTAHPVASALCQACGIPLVSTSANLSGQPPARSAEQVGRQLGGLLDYIVPGATGGAARPTEIRDLRSGMVVRA